MESNYKYCVYKLESPEGKVYIGCTGNNPKDRWDYGCKYHHNKELASDIKRFGWDNFKHSIVRSDMSEDEAYELEKETIYRHNSNDPNFGYNKSIGGKSNAGVIRSDEYRQALRERTSGERHHFYGKHLSEEHRRKISESNMGHAVSLETRRKIGAGNRPNKREVLCVETGIVYESINAASRMVNTPSSNIRSVCAGKTKTAGGYSWKYVDKEENENAR